MSILFYSNPPGGRAFFNPYGSAFTVWLARNISSLRLLPAKNFSSISFEFWRDCLFYSGFTKFSLAVKEFNAGQYRYWAEYFLKKIQLTIFEYRYRYGIRTTKFVQFKKHPSWKIIITVPYSSEKKVLVPVSFGKKMCWKMP